MDWKSSPLAQQVRYVFFQLDVISWISTQKCQFAIMLSVKWRHVFKGSSLALHSWLGHWLAESVKRPTGMYCESVQKHWKVFSGFHLKTKKRRKKSKHMWSMCTAGWRDKCYFLIQALICLLPEAWDNEDEWNSLHCCFSTEYATCIIWHSQFTSILHFRKHIKTSQLFSSKIRVQIALWLFFMWRKRQNLFFYYELRQLIAT